MITWQDLHHSELTAPQLHAPLKLCSEVSVVEQQCICQDVGGDDLVGENCHLLGWRDGELLAYVWVPKSGETYDPVMVGRAIAGPTVRSEKLGHQLMA